MDSLAGYRHLELRPVAGSFGAEVVAIDGAGPDLERGLGEAAWHEIQSALLAHRLLLFRGQALSPETIVAASRRFGRPEAHIDSAHLLEGHPEIIKIGNLKVDGVMRSLFVNAREEWHFDYSYVSPPSIAALFYALAVPPDGGDTLFADSTAAFEALDAAEQAELRGLTAVHSWAHFHRQLEAMDPTRRPLSAEALAKHPPVRQPLVYRHPATGRESLWLCPHVIVEVEGLPAARSAALLERLQAHVVQARFFHRHR